MVRQGLDPDDYTCGYRHVLWYLFSRGTNSLREWMFIAGSLAPTVGLTLVNR